MTSKLVAWAVSPEWVTPAQAATLLGPHYTSDMISELMKIGALVVESRNDEMLIELQSISEYRDAVFDVTQ